MKLLLKAIIYTGLYYPMIFILLFYSFAIRVIIKLGQVPEYNHPDPKDLNFETHRNLIYTTGEYLPISIAIIIIGMLLFVFRRNLLEIRSIHFILSATLILILFITFISPIMEWFGD